MRNLRYISVLFRRRLADALSGPMALALLPTGLLACFWLGGEPVLLASAVLFPTLTVLLAATERRWRYRLTLPDSTRGRHPGLAFESALANALHRLNGGNKTVICAVITLGPAHVPLGKAESSFFQGTVLRSALRRRDRVFAIARNRFGVVITSGRDLSNGQLNDLVVRLKSDIEQAFWNANTPLVSAPRVGVSRASCEKIETPSRMISNAEYDLGSPAVCGRRVERGDPSGSRDNDQKKSLVRALGNGEICGWFQPQIGARTGRVAGFETLARWQHPERGLISPADFLPAVNKHKLNSRLHALMLDHALNAFETWREIVPDAPPSVGINLSQQDLQDQSLPEHVQWELDRRDIAPDRLCLEVLETVVCSSQDDPVTRMVQQLAKIGCQIDLDDFGTGHASISCLRNLPLNRIKIDRSFVQNVGADPKRAAMLSAILTMARQLGLETLAEGVETQVDQNQLAQMGCGFLQGYFIARPMSLNDSATWLKARSGCANHTKSDLSMCPTTGKQAVG